jgi:hypothetical protein
MTDYICVERNVTENVIPIRIPGFVENPTSVIRISDSIDFTINHALLTTAVSLAIPLVSPVLTVTSTTVTNGPSSNTYNTTAADCCIMTGIGSSFTSTGAYLGLGAGAL